MQRRGATPTGRTSLITDPSDGRLPPRKASRQAYEATPEAKWLQAVDWGLAPADGPENYGLNARCIIERRVPITPSSDNNHVQILQSPEHVVILQEKIHDFRIIPVTDQPDVRDQVRQWLGVSRGRWDGDTIVVETKNVRALVVCPKNDFTLPDHVEISIHGGAPHERLWVHVVVGQVVVDGCNQLLHAAKDSTAKALLGQLAEPALDQVEPRGACGGEVQPEARVRGQPFADGCMFVGAVVVQDPMQGEVARELTVEAPQELQKLLMSSRDGGRPRCARAASPRR